jgi:hypothetical protein
MQPTLYPHINTLLDELLARLQMVLGDKLVGLYLYGSLVTGDFDDDTSDIDLLAALTSDLDENEAAAIKQMHDDFVRAHPRWANRIEVQYFSTEGLRTFKSKTNKMGNISPGEPFHIFEADKKWLMNWFFVQENGVIIFGPSPRTLIDPILKDEYIQSVKDHVGQWNEWVKDTIVFRGAQAYAILTLCRALYSYRKGDSASKIKAAAWAAQELPEWASLINNAVVWRKKSLIEQVPDHAATYPETERFVNYVVGEILK